MINSLISNHTLKENYFGSTLKTKDDLCLILLLWVLAIFKIWPQQCQYCHWDIKNELSLGYARLKKCVIKFSHKGKYKWEKLEHKDKAIFDIPFMIQSHAESMKKIQGAI